MAADQAAENGILVTFAHGRLRVHRRYGAGHILLDGAREKAVHAVAGSNACLHMPVSFFPPSVFTPLSKRTEYRIRIVASNSAAAGSGDLGPRRIGAEPARTTSCQLYWRLLARNKPRASTLSEIP